MEQADFDAMLAIEETGSLAAAAERLFVTQPALTRRVKRLEEELGCTLVERRRGVRATRLTEAGRRLAGAAPRWRALVDEVRGPAEDGRLPFAVGCVDSVSTFLLSDAFPRFMREHPQVSLEVSLQHSRNSYELVRTGGLDAALVASVQHGDAVAATPLFAESFVVASRTDLGPGPCHPASLDPAREIRVPWHPNLEAWHRFWMGDALPLATTDQMALMMRFLQEEDTWAVVQASAAPAARAAGLSVCALSDPPADVTCHLIVAASDPHPLAESLGRLVCEAVAGQPGIRLLGAAA